MKTTTNFGLKKPDGTDIINIEDLNSNMDTIDTQLAAREGLIRNAAAKTTLADADTIPLSDSAASAGTKKITFGNIKTALKTYFDTLYNKYTHPAYTARAAGLYKVTIDNTGHVSAAAAVTSADITGLGIPAMASYTATISTTWTGSAAPYTQVVTVSGLLTTDKQVHIAPNYSATLATAQAQREAWNLISKADVTANNQITFTCFEEKATTAIPIKLEVIR